VRLRVPAIVALVSIATLFASCGGSGGAKGAAGETVATGFAHRPASESNGKGGAVPSELESAATGDIPDNQTFLVFRDAAAGYSIRYPEGWARQGSGLDVTFREKANVIRIAIRNGSKPDSASALKGLEQLKRADATVKVVGRPSTGAGQAVKIGYSRQSAPDPVTGKRLQLVVDRYEYGKGGKVAVLDLETPVGVDNIDAYRLISKSFAWH
jgi:hypothetical protein